MFLYSVDWCSASVYVAPIYSKFDKLRRIGLYTLTFVETPLKVKGVNKMIDIFFYIF